MYGPLIVFENATGGGGPPPVEHVSLATPVYLSRGTTFFSIGAITRATTLISFIRMFSEGPAVSLKGSPTVSPTTAALCAGDALAAQRAGFDVLLGVVPRAAGVGHEQRHHHARHRHAGQQAAEHLGPNTKPTTTGVSTPSSAGTVIFLMAAAVEMSTQRA